MLGHANRTKSRPPIGPDDYTVEDHGHETFCWIRVGYLNNKGYGNITIAGKPMKAHRAMYEQEVGPIPAGKILDHLCRVRACMRPSHLEPVTLAQNLRRGVHVKLTQSDVLVIRGSSPAVTTKELAERYGISASQMSRVRRGLRWG